MKIYRIKTVHRGVSFMYGLDKITHNVWFYTNILTRKHFPRGVFKIQVCDGELILDGLSIDDDKYWKDLTARWRWRCG